MKIVSVVGARPQFIKAAVLVKAIEEYASRQRVRVEHSLLHTGQHYDARLSDIFFEQLGLPKPQTSLGLGSGKHGMQTAAMLASIEAAFDRQRPDAVIVYGDTNSTLAGALACAKMRIPLIHLEAGLRSFDRSMPEEVNRVVSDHVSDLLLCPTTTAIENLRTEGLGARGQLVGDVMLDAVLLYSGVAQTRYSPHAQMRKPFALVTLHRAGNTDDPARLHAFVELLRRFPIRVVLPMHPRLKHCLGPGGCAALERMPHVELLPPAGYLEMLALERDALVILTDSGGVQKEAYFLGVPCLTMREETEWGETLHDGWNRLVGLSAERILPLIASLVSDNGAVPRAARDLGSFGAGVAGEACAHAIVRFTAGQVVALRARA